MTKNMFILFFSFLAILILSGLDLVNGQDIDCEVLREKFANTTAQFTLCAIDNSRPITMCENCSNSYADVLDSFKNMSKAVQNATSCLDMLVNQDRLQIVRVLYDNSVDLWNRAKCYECYDNNAIRNHTLSNKIEQFREYYNTLSNCIKRSEDINLCSDCMKDYVKLDNFYKSISNINEKIGVCMDIVDVMNTTWNFWSHNCCKYRRHDEYIFIGSSVGILLLTVVFYLIAQFYKAKNAPTIIQQSRFFGSLNLFDEE